MLLTSTPKPRQRSHLCSAPPAPRQPGTPSSCLATSHHFPCTWTSASAWYNPTQKQVFTTTVFSRGLRGCFVGFGGFGVGCFFKHVSEAAVRSQAPALEEQGEARESFWKCQVRSFQSSPCHPRTAPTSQRNKRLLKLGRAAHPCSSVKWLLVALRDTSSIHHSAALLWHSFVFGETFKAKDYQHTSSSPGASSQVQTAGTSL